MTTSVATGPAPAPPIPSVDAESQRARFYRIVPSMLADDERLALVLADIGVGALDPEMIAPVAARIVNVGIREQLMVGVAGGLALAGLRPLVHTFAPFLVERPFEQVKLDLGHQGIGAVLVSAGGSYGWPEGGQTHFGHRDVALLDTLDGWTVHVPGHPDEAEDLIRRASSGAGLVYVRLDEVSNRHAHRVLPDGRMAILRRGSGTTVIAVGPMLDRVLAATVGLDVNVLYAHSVRPLDVDTLLGVLARPDVVMVEPYLAGTSAAELSTALGGVRHRLLTLGVHQREIRHYGTRAEHDRAHGLDIHGLRASIHAFVGD